MKMLRSVRYRSRPKFVFVFGAENGLFGHFRLFSFSAENDFSFLFYFSFSLKKMSSALGRKCYVKQLKFCDIGTGDIRFRFSTENGISFSSAFPFTTKNEKYND